MPRARAALTKGPFRRTAWPMIDMFLVAAVASSSQTGSQAPEMAMGSGSLEVGRSAGPGACSSEAARDGRAEF